MRFRFSLLLVIVFLQFLALPLMGREIKIQVAVTSDVHARIFPYDFVNDRPMQTSLANVHYLVQAVRTRPGSNLILLDNGDLVQGTPTAYYANFVQETKQHLFSRIMNLMQYDAATVGNHDIEAGPAVYNRLKKEFRFPYLGANVINKETGEPYFEPYTVIRRQGVRIAVLGLTTTGVPNWLPEHLWEGLEFQEMAEAAAYWVKHIQEKENPDAIVGLFHSGMGPANPEPSQFPLENAVQYVARTVPGIDVIFTGHDHRERNEIITNDEGGEVLIVGPGRYAENLAVAELTFDRISRNEIELLGKKGDLVSTLNVAPSQEFFQRFEKDINAIVDFANEPVGRLRNDLASIEAFFGPAAFVDLVHAIQLEATGAEVSFTAPLSFNETLKAGMLSVRDFFKLYQYENYLYVMELTGQEIRDYLEYSYGIWLNQMKNEDDHLLLFRFDDEGKPVVDSNGRHRLRHPTFNFDSAAGIRYTVDASKPAGQRVDVIAMEDGSAFDLQKKYRVAINSYRGSGGGGHLTEGAGIPHAQLRERIVFSTEKDLRTALIEYFREQKEVDPQARDNWKIIPESWAEKGRKKDLELLNP
ncbi:MAG: bifunctional metallophosphatase/5'-nucleotidase [Bacteroides sp.]|jgi:2',3'-cyclic-nucleotide 2'-phosphodiesterase/3'-nucleotidase|nr:bifunctional metallophosphatase/5'-nucleotidase [Bacteroides sp.]